MIVGFAQIDRLIGKPGERGRPMRAPASLADRRVLGGRRERARIGGGIDHRGDEAFGAEIEHAGGERKIADRHAYDRRRPTLPHGGDAGEHRGDIPQSVLTFDRHRRKAFAAERFGNQRIGQAAPAAEYGFSGAQPAGEGERGYGHDAAAACWMLLGNVR